MIRRRAGFLEGSCASLLTLAVLLVVADARAAESIPSTPRAVDEATGLEEVIVSGSKLYEIRRDIRAAEERFYKLYNTLNTNHDFDVSCSDEARTGSRFIMRICEPEYQIRAEADEGQALLRGYAVIPASLVVAARKDEYRKNMLALLKKNPQLFDLLRERVNMERQFVLTRKERFKGHWILFE